MKKIFIGALSVVIILPVLYIGSLVIEKFNYVSSSIEASQTAILHVKSDKSSDETQHLPQFRYNPNAYELGIFEKEKVNCPVCNLSRDYYYQGPFYSVEEVEGICPWCIKDGSAAKKYDGAFHDSASTEPVDNQDYLTELTSKTPGYSGWQQEVWLSHCGDFCAFSAYVGWNEIAYLKDELKADLNKIKSEYGLSQSDIEKYLVNGSGMQGYLFQCLHCSKHRLTIDTN